MKKLFANNKVVLNFILLIPIINAVADVLTNYYPPTTINPGSIRTLIILMFLLILALKKTVFKGMPAIIAIFLIYLVVLIPFSSNIFKSFISYIHIFIPLMMFPLGFYYIRTIDNLKRLNTSLIIAASIICLNLIISQLYKLGPSAYAEDSFYTGGADTAITSLLAIIVLMSPVIYPLCKTKSLRIITTIVLVLAVVFTIVNLRRGPIIALFGGFFIYGIFTSRKIQLFKYVILSLCVLLLINQFFSKTFQKQLSARTVKFGAKYKKMGPAAEARYLETLVVWDEFRNKSLKHSLLGSEPFNSAYYFGRRSLHVDYNVLLHGAGIIGLSIYLLIYLIIIKKYNKVYKFNKRIWYFKEMRAVFFSIIFAAFLIGFSRSLGNIGFQSILFLWFGAIIRINREHYYLLKKMQID